MGYITIPGISFFLAFLGYELKPVWLLILAKQFMRGKKYFSQKKKWHVSEYWIWMNPWSLPLIQPIYHLILSYTDILYGKNITRTPPICACWAFHKKIDTIQTQGHQWDHVLLCLAHIRVQIHSKSVLGSSDLGFAQASQSFNQWLNYNLLCSGGLSCWNGKGSCPKHCHKSGKRTILKSVIVHCSIKIRIKVPCQTVN